MSEKQLAFDLEPDVSLPQDAPIITFDLNEARRYTDKLHTLTCSHRYRDAHAYALRLRQAAECMAKELERFIY